MCESVLIFPPKDRKLASYKEEFREGLSSYRAVYIQFVIQSIVVKGGITAAVCSESAPGFLLAPLGSPQSVSFAVSRPVCARFLALSVSGKKAQAVVLSGAAPCPSCAVFRQGRAALAPVSAWSVVGLGFCFFKCGVRGLVKIPFPPRISKSLFKVFL
jgi:hypothetical protein